MTSFVPMKDPSSFRKIAAAMWKAPNNPVIYGVLDLDATPALAHLQSYREKHGVKVTMTHLVAQAVGLAMRDLPELNAKIHWGRIMLRQSVDVFLQVMSEDGRDLSGVKIDSMDRKTLTQVAEELSSKSKKIRAGEDAAMQKSRSMFKRMPGFVLRWILRISDFLVNDLHIDLSSQGMPLDPFGSVMVTSVGMFGLDTGFAPFVPISRCPIVVLVSSVVDRPWVENGQIVIRPILRVTGSMDHRIVDGYSGAKFANRVKELLLKPEEMDGMASGATARALAAGTPA